ncbi:MAG: hypothetical protein RIM72_01020 [Alphaproteobacteria bacterium]
MKSVIRFFRLFPGILLACAVLTGCVSLGALTGGTDEFDGVWAGRFTFSSGENTCVRRGGVRADISQGDVDGDVSWQDSDSRSTISGFIKEGGAFTGTASRGSRSFADLEGTFSELNAEGTWTSSRCRGAWSMRKVRNAS